MMKIKVFILVLVIVWNYPLFVQAQYFKLYKDTDLNLILQQSRTDSLLRLERLTALTFHSILNEYRKSNHLDTLQWNETLWLTCRNHSIYMNHNQNLTHSESKEETYFSGENPGERLAYVQKNERTMWWNGENALYNFSGKGSTIKEIAKSVAKASFEQWKESPGHNQNMLSKSPTHHGVSFIISENRVYATSMFGYKNSNYWANNSNSESKQIDKDTLSETQTLSKTGNESVKKVKLNLAKEKLTLEKLFLSHIGQATNNQTYKNDKILYSGAKKHAEYIAVNDLSGHSQKRGNKSFYAKDLAKRLARSEGKALWFLTQKTDIIEYIFLIETVESDYKEEDIFQKLFENLITENQINVEQIEKSGFSVKIIRKKNILKVYGVLLLKLK